MNADVEKAVERIEERFWSKVEKTDGCWLWVAGVRRPDKPYGVFYDGKRQVTAHRWIFQHLHGALPVDVHVCHRCDNPRCVRPDHLFAGSSFDNMSDCSKKGRNGMQRHPDKSSIKSIGRAVGSSVSSAKLIETDVVRIKKLRALGVSTRDVADVYGMSIRAVNKITQGKSWKHVALRDQEAEIATLRERLAGTIMVAKLQAKAAHLGAEHEQVR
jgi:hypothetical protein